MTETEAKREANNSPTAWFAVLERARLVGDPVLERRAMSQLARLGVKVTFSTPKGGTDDR